MSMVFIWPAFADGGQPSNGMVSFLLPVAMIGALYFLLIRPKQKLDKQHKELLATVRKGDKVTTSCGMKATVSKIINDREVVLEIANNVHCKFMKSAIARLDSGLPETPAINEPPREQKTQPVLPGGDVLRKIGAATLKATKTAPTKSQGSAKKTTSAGKGAAGTKSGAKTPGKKSSKAPARKAAGTRAKSVSKTSAASKGARKPKRSAKSKSAKK